MSAQVVSPRWCFFHRSTFQSLPAVWVVSWLPKNVGISLKLWLWGFSHCFMGFQVGEACFQVGEVCFQVGEACFQPKVWFGLLCAEHVDPLQISICSMHCTLTFCFTKIRMVSEMVYMIWPVWWSSYSSKSRAIHILTSLYCTACEAVHHSSKPVVFS